jgi:hypothetical protein
MKGAVHSLVAPTADNIQLRCRAHNQYEARLFFGDTLVGERPERSHR